MDWDEERLNRLRAEEMVKKRVRIADLEHELKEATSEIRRHHEDFEHIREIVAAHAPIFALERTEEIQREAAARMCNQIMGIVG